MPLVILQTYLKKLGPRRFYALVFFIFLILILAILYSLNLFPFKEQDLSPDAEAKRIIEKVDKLVFLPKDETPTTAKVSNPDLLMDQVFFADAKKGDVVLIYPNAKKAILYDPTVNKIVNISKINIGNSDKPAETLRTFSEENTNTTSTNNGGEF